MICYEWVLRIVVTQQINAHSKKFPGNHGNQTSWVTSRYRLSLIFMGLKQQQKNNLKIGESHHSRNTLWYQTKIRENTPMCTAFSPHNGHHTVLCAAAEVVHAKWESCATKVIYQGVLSTVQVRLGKPKTFFLTTVSSTFGSLFQHETKISFYNVGLLWFSIQKIIPTF